MISRTVARRYVKAIFDLAGEQGKETLVGGQLESLHQLISGHEQLNNVFRNPAIQPAKKQAIFEEMEPQLELDSLTANFVRLLIRKGRINYLELITKEYEVLELERQGKVVVSVKTAHTLSDRQRRQLQETLQTVSGKKVELESTQEPELIGGLVARIGGTIYDGSVQHQLELIEQRLKKE